MERHKLAALILAGGKSSRMRALKPLLNIEKKTVIEWDMDLFRKANVNSIRVVVGFHSEKLLKKLRDNDVMIIKNTDPERGMFSSIQTGVSTFKEDVEGFFLLPADMPMIRSQTIEHMIEAHRLHPNKIIFPVFLGHKGHPPLIPKIYFNEISNAKDTGNLREILEQYKDNWLEIICPDQGILMDMDTQPDYRRMIQYANQRDFPNPEECTQLFSLFNTSENIRRHGEKVAQVAFKIGLLLNKTGKYSICTEKLSTAALLHDIGKGKPKHANVGAELIAKEGFPELSVCIASHMNLHFEPLEMSLSEKEILFLADKMVKETELIALDERFSIAIEKNKDKINIQNAIKERYDTAKTIKEIIEKALGISNIYSLFNSSIV